MKLILGLSGRRVAADVAPDTEVLPCLPWISLVCLKPWIRGVAVHKLGLLPVVDLSCLLDAQPLYGSADKNRIISVGAGGVRTGFLVASVSREDDDEEAEAADTEGLESIMLDHLCLDLLADPGGAVVSS